jgi:hypothetical protein
MSKTLELYIDCDEDIKVGDVVRLHDGSSVTLDPGYFKNINENVYIIYSYPELIGEYSILKDIDCEVVEVGIKNKISHSNSDFCYLQDILVKIGSGYIRVSSGHVRKRIRESNLNQLLGIFK